MNSTYIIGEIGQNHNGSIVLAKEIIDRASRPVVDQLFGNKLKPMNAVKFTKRNLDQELSASGMDKPYDSPNSFGKTYGEHRKALELTDEQHYELFQYAKAKGLDFVETLCAPGCLSMLQYFRPDRLKVASRDLTNLPLLEALAETGIPMIISTGMAAEKELDQALEVITKHHDDVAILHCVSQYPTEYQNVNLKTIPYLKEKYSQFKIGYSDHTIGIMIPIAAVTMGAEIIEKHITLDREMRGSDQQCSLGPDGISRMMRDMRNLEKAVGTEGMFIEEDVEGNRVKLERSVATIRELPKGHIIEVDDLHLLSPGDGFKWNERDQIIGQKLTKDILANEVIYSSDFE
jgi:sialic acid synthase